MTHVSCASSASSSRDFEGLRLPIWQDNRILICNNSFENTFLKDVIVGITRASPAGSCGLYRNAAELAKSEEG